MTTGDNKYVIAESARKHGISDNDMLYAVENYIERVKDPRFDNKLLYIGFNTSGNTLEAVTVEFNLGVETIIHAMKLRLEFLKFIEEVKHGQRK